MVLQKHAQMEQRDETVRRGRQPDLDKEGTEYLHSSRTPHSAGKKGYANAHHSDNSISGQLRKVVHDEEMKCR